MSPTVFRDGAFRFYFFSREEPRMHVHVQGPEGEAKFWLEPDVELASSVGFPARHLKAIQAVVEERQDEIRAAWERYFKS